MRGATSITLQPHQILRLPRKKNLIFDPRHIWNVIYNARSNKHHPPTSPNTAPATKNDSHDWYPWHMKRHLQCAEQQASPSNLTKYCACHAKLHSKIKEKFAENSWSVISNARPIRAWSDHDPNMKLQNWTRPFAELTFPPSATHFVLKITTFRAPAIYPDFTEYCACHKKWRSKITKYCACHATWLSWLMSVTHNTSFTMRGATSITLQPHQMLPLPRKMMRIIDCRRIWNVIYNARSNRHHPPTSPNTAPATQNCTPKSKKNLPKTVEASFPIMRGRFEHDPTMIRTWSDHEIAKLNPSVRRAYFSPLGNAFCIENYNISRSGYLPRFHRILRLPQKVTLQDHQILRLPRNMTLMIDVRHPWHVIYNARSNKHHPPTSPNAAPATKNDAHHWLSSHMKRHLQCAEPQASPSNLTKYCACHAKWLSWLIFVTYGTSFTMRGATGITLQPHQILRLPRKSALQNLSEILRERLKRQFQCAADSTMIRTWSEHDPNMNSSSRTRPFAEVTFRASETHFVLKITTFRAPAIFSNFTEYCACHEKWHSDITKYCACHEKWCASLIVVAYETSFAMRGATGIALQPHQILRLPRKMTLMIDLRHIWNVIYNARSNRHHPPTSPNTAPATQKCTPKSKRNSPRTVEAPIPMRGRFDHDPNMIRTWSEHELVISHPPVRRGYFSRFGDAFCIENYNISRSGYLLKFHRILRLPRKVTLRHHQILRLPRKVALRHHQMLRLPRKVTLRHHQILRLPRKVTLRHHQILNCYWTELLLRCCWAVTELLLNCYWHWTDLLLSCYWDVTELSCYWTVTELNCYWTVTQLLLNWPVTELSCYSTVTGLLLNCYWTDLLLNWAVTQLLLDCYWTDLLLSCYWTVTLHCYLNSYCTGLFAFLNLRNSEVSQLNFLW